MKKVLSLILTLVLMCSLIPAAHAASDEATQAAQTLYELGLFRGTGTNPDGTPIFDLDKTPTRNQAVIMLVRLLGKEEEALAGNWTLPFTDVAKNSAAYPYIGYAYANGLTNGTTATTYSGTNPIRTNQYITFVLRALGYTSGTDFAVSTAWEFSDKIGITKGEYSAANAGSLLRGGIAAISHRALSAKVNGTGKTLLETLTEENAIGSNSFHAWYEVSENGKLTIKTDYNIFRKEGYWVLIDLTFRGGSHSHDSQDIYSIPAKYDITSLLTFVDDNSEVISICISLYKNAAGRESFWDVWTKTNSKEQALAAFADQLVMRTEIKDRIVIEQVETAYSVTKFSIARNETTQSETYTAQISEPILTFGEYGLVYEGRTGWQNASLSYIGRGQNCLTFTREIDHFATQGSAGTFFITHNSYQKCADGTILCTVSRSPGFDYTIQ